MKRNNLSKILNDKTSGSSELVYMINKFFKNNIDDRNLIRKSIVKLSTELKSFEAVISYLKSISKIMASGSKERLKTFINNFENDSMASYLNIYKKLKPLLRDKTYVFTLSNSQTVYEVLKCWFNDNRKIKIIIAESRPAFEGRIFAKKLLKFGVKLLLIPDCNLAEHISKCDAVIIGADKILSNYDIVNKTGSRNAAIIAKFYNKPFFVISSKKKLSKQKLFRSEPLDSNEIWNFRHTNLKIDNHCLELVPKKLITKIITEKNRFRYSEPW